MDGQNWGGTKEQPKYCKCHRCNGYRANLQRALKIDSHDAEEYKTWTPEQKLAFKERNITKVSKDIAASLSVIVEEGWEESHTDEFGMVGGYLGKADVGRSTNTSPTSWRSSSQTRRKFFAQ